MKELRYKNLARTGLIVLAAGALVFVTYGGQAYAQDSTATTATSPTTSTQVEHKSGSTTNASQESEATTEQHTIQTINSQMEKAKAALEAKRAALKEKLTADKLKVCQDREKMITQTMGRLSDRSTDHLNVFSKIADRVEAFYVSKGKTVANYDSLVADVNAKKAAVETAIANAKASGTSFSCTDANPHLAAQQFQTAHAAAVTALQAYRVSIKNLIVAVKSAQSDASTPAATGSSSTGSTTKTQSSTTAGTN